VLRHAFTFADWFVLGVGADIAGAFLLAWSFIVQSPNSIAREILLPLRTYDGLARGFGGFARSLARQRAEARIGGTLLVAGFVAQLVGYLFTDGSSHFESWNQRLLAVGIVAAEWIAVSLLWKYYVPASAQRTFDAAFAAQEADVAARVRAAAEAE
jgi:hypothetical protein